jgi:hypothetical protein
VRRYLPMRLAPPLLALATLATLATLAAPAAADRAADFSAQLIGADADTIGVNIVHDAKGWSMKVRPKPGADQVVIAAPTIPAKHGDYVVFVAPGRTRIAWVLIGDTHGVPSAEDPVVWTFTVADGSVAVTEFGDLFTTADKEHFLDSTAGTFWYSQTTNRTIKKATLTMPTAHGKPVVVDLKAGTVTRKK